MDASAASVDTTEQAPQSHHWWARSTSSKQQNIDANLALWKSLTPEQKYKLADTLSDKLMAACVLSDLDACDCVSTDDFMLCSHNGTFDPTTIGITQAQVTWIFNHVPHNKDGREQLSDIVVYLFDQQAE